jgi:hypothetical protein
MQQVNFDVVEDCGGDDPSPPEDDSNGEIVNYT